MRSSVAAAPACSGSAVSAPLAATGRRAAARRLWSDERSACRKRASAKAGPFFAADAFRQAEPQPTIEMPWPPARVPMKRLPDEDQRRDHVAILVEQLHLAAGELPAGDDARGPERAARGRGAVAAGAGLGGLGEVELALVGAGTTVQPPSSFSMVSPPERSRPGAGGADRMRVSVTKPPPVRAIWPPSRIGRSASAAREHRRPRLLDLAIGHRSGGSAVGRHRHRSAPAASCSAWPGMCLDRATLRRRSSLQSSSAWRRARQKRQCALVHVRNVRHGSENRTRRI